MSRDVNRAIDNLSAFLNSSFIQSHDDDAIVSVAAGVIKVGDLRALLVAMTEAYEVMDDEVRRRRSGAMTFDRDGERIEPMDDGPMERWVESMRRPVGLLSVVAK